MASLDVFNNDIFGLTSLSAAIDKLPYKPGFLGAMGLFRRQPIRTTSAFIEERHGRLSLVQSSARGTQRNPSERPKRQGRSFQVPHLPQFGAVMADDVQGIRAFGAETEMEAVAQVVNDVLQDHRDNLETTIEYHRMGAIKGDVLDADGSTIYNWFDEFGITEKVVAFDDMTDEDEIKLKAAEVIRHIRDALGADTFDVIHAVCGDEFFDALTSSASAKQAFDRWQEGRFFREQQLDTGFPYAGIMWHNYRGKIGDVDFTDPWESRFFPSGTRDAFLEVLAPADFIETVNTMGMPYYAKQERMKFDKGIEIHTQSNPLLVCTRPAILVKGTTPEQS